MAFNYYKDNFDFSHIDFQDDGYQIPIFREAIKMNIDNKQWLIAYKSSFIDWYDSLEVLTNTDEQKLGLLKYISGYDYVDWSQAKKVAEICAKAAKVWEIIIADLKFYERNFFSVVNEPQPLKRPKRPAKKLTEEKAEVLYNSLIKSRYIPEVTIKEAFLYVFAGGEMPSGYCGLKWLKTDRLCVYLIEMLFAESDTKLTDWRAAREFGINNPAQQRMGYADSDTGKPKGYEGIDKILRVAGI
jgi:hypothetical protein